MMSRPPDPRALIRPVGQSAGKAADWGWDWPNQPRGVLPPSLDDMAPGAGLAAVLDGVDRRELNGYELVTLIKARARLVAWSQAHLNSSAKAPLRRGFCCIPARSA